MRGKARDGSGSPHPPLARKPLGFALEVLGESARRDCVFSPGSGPLPPGGIARHQDGRDMVTASPSCSALAASLRERAIDRQHESIQAALLVEEEFIQRQLRILEDQLRLEAVQTVRHPKDGAGSPSRSQSPCRRGRGRSPALSPKNLDSPIIHPVVVWKANGKEPFDFQAEIDRREAEKAWIRRREVEALERSLRQQEPQEVRSRQSQTADANERRAVEREAALRKLREMEERERQAAATRIASSFRGMKTRREVVKLQRRKRDVELQGRRGKKAFQAEPEGTSTLIQRVRIEKAVPSREREIAKRREREAALRKLQEVEERRRGDESQKAHLLYQRQQVSDGLLKEAIAPVSQRKAGLPDIGSNHSLLSAFAAQTSQGEVARVDTNASDNLATAMALRLAREEAAEGRAKQREAALRRVKDLEEKMMEKAAIRIQGLFRMRQANARTVALKAQHRAQEEARRLDKIRKKQEAEDMQKRADEEALRLNQELLRLKQREAALRKLEELEEKGRTSAATKIQNCRRSQLARRELCRNKARRLEEVDRLDRERRAAQERLQYLQHQKLVDCVIKVQRNFRGYKDRTFFAVLRRMQRDEERKQQRARLVAKLKANEERRAEMAAIKIQRMYRGRISRIWFLGLRQKRQEEADRMKKERELRRLRNRTPSVEARMSERRVELSDAERAAIRERNLDAIRQKLQALEERERSFAASRIQGMYRMRKAREELDQMKKCQKGGRRRSLLRLQRRESHEERMAARAREREATLRRLEEMEDREREFAAALIQGMYRAHQARQQVDELRDQVSEKERETKERLASATKWLDGHAAKLVGGLCGRCGNSYVEDEVYCRACGAPSFATRASRQCSNCGNECAGADKYCRNCGRATRAAQDARHVHLASPPRQCGTCGSQCAAEDTYCRQCGKRIHAVPDARHCSACGSQCPAEDIYCRQCGRKIHAVPDVREATRVREQEVQRRRFQEIERRKLEVAASRIQSLYRGRQARQRCDALRAARSAKARVSKPREAQPPASPESLFMQCEGHCTTCGNACVEDEFFCRRCGVQRLAQRRPDKPRELQYSHGVEAVDKQAELLSRRKMPLATPCAAPPEAALHHSHGCLPFEISRCDNALSNGVQVERPPQACEVSNMFQGSSLRHKQSAAGEELFDALDRNKDGVISRAEFEQLHVQRRHCARTEQTDHQGLQKAVAVLRQSIADQRRLRSRQVDEVARLRVLLQLGNSSTNSRCHSCDQRVVNLQCVVTSLHKFGLAALKHYERGAKDPCEAMVKFVTDVIEAIDHVSHLDPQLAKLASYIPEMLGDLGKT